MDISFKENGYKIETDGDIASVVFPDGRRVEIDVPLLSELGLDSDGHTFHGYVRVHNVGKQDELTLWRNLREHPAPQDYSKPRDGVVADYSETSIPRIGTVTHFVHDDARVIANVTNEDHILHPGMVLRVNDGNNIVTFGVGNGLFAERNVPSAGQFWGENAYLIGAEAAQEAARPGMSENEQRELRLRTLTTVKELTTWHKENGKEDFGSDAPAVTDAGSAIVWVQEQLSEAGISQEDLNAVNVEGTNSRDQVRALYDLAQIQPDIQAYLQNVDYWLAIAETLEGADNAKPIVGTQPECDPLTLDETAGIINDPKRGWGALSVDRQMDFCLPRNP